ncbi:uncharacterized protein [Lolium perenne]|uniref:uncharacterized protein n=1 Tax=Lolium perenne TaxID=4522 RepID=UPI003A993910
MRPELWLDFPFLPDDADSDDFDMTDAQQDHALAVESVAPELADLRIELCPGHISEGCFWKIYFVLLHPKLTKEAADLLSTPQAISNTPTKAEVVVTFPPSTCHIHSSVGEVSVQLLVKQATIG